MRLMLLVAFAFAFEADVKRRPSNEDGRREAPQSRVVRQHYECVSVGTAARCPFAVRLP